MKQIIQKKIAFFAIMILTALWSGFVISTLWGWFIVPNFGLPRLPYGIVIGIAMIFILILQRNNINDISQTILVDLMMAMRTVFWVSAWALYLGWVVRIFV